MRAFLILLGILTSLSALAADLHFASSTVVAGGGVLSYLVLIPMIKFFGEHLQGPLPPGRIPIADMQPDDVRTAYVLYVGSGAVAAGGIISLFRSLPTIWHGLKEGLRDVGLAK